MPTPFRLAPRGGAIYQQIIEQFRRLILVGVLGPGAQLPTAKQLAIDLAINPNTVVRAYRELEHDGLVFSTPGRGTFVRADLSPRATRAAARDQTADLFVRAIRGGLALGLAESEVRSAFELALSQTSGAMRSRKHEHA